MKKNIYLLALVIVIGCSSTQTKTPQNNSVSFLGMDQPAIEKQLGLPHRISYENGNQILEYWKDEGEFLGDVKYKIVLQNGKVISFSKEPTSSQFKAQLSESELHNQRLLYQVNSNNFNLEKELPAK